MGADQPRRLRETQCALQSVPPTTPGTRRSRHREAPAASDCRSGRRWAQARSGSSIPSSWRRASARSCPASGMPAGDPSSQRDPVDREHALGCRGQMGRVGIPDFGTHECQMVGRVVAVRPCRCGAPRRDGTDVVHLQVQRRDRQPPAQPGHHRHAACLIDEARQHAGCERLLLVRQLLTPTKT